MTRIGLLATGGTIASRATPAGHQADVKAAELLESVSALPPGIEVTTQDVTTRGSYALDTGDIVGLARTVRTSLEDGLDGLVVTHGTDALEESAFLLDLVHADPRPVVFTGAQRPFDDSAGDGPSNLRDAIGVAASPGARDRGVLIAFDGVVLPARGATKIDTAAIHAFDAPGRGPLATVSAERMDVLAYPKRADPLPLDLDHAALPRVDVIAAYPGSDGTLVDASVAAGAGGIVIAALGAGNAGPAMVATVDAAIRRAIPVLVCSRVLAGPVRPMYAGGGARLAEVGAVFGSDLSPWQGRLLLATALAVDPNNATTVVREWIRDTELPDKPVATHRPSGRNEDT